ncbi:hypothetical protein [Bradyrhizobium sp. RD5-C2]|uniref:hypothetical protein n=1 Tax=Bradyrhizobium sp. RD5-C2 TaxID=244562 RepID=UPI001CC4D8BC|nr:hypothetical protein [Bradyrhizobium sp. RD5-C2]GIQ77385.1 hypothetical protein BraRD5C2_58340 [Bradyrhizobium sp. RD5-C2]
MGIVVLAATLLFKMALLTDIAANAGAAFLVILAMTFGLILPRMLSEGRGS